MFLSYRELLRHMQHYPVEHQTTEENRIVIITIIMIIIIMIMIMIIIMTLTMTVTVITKMIMIIVTLLMCPDCLAEEKPSADLHIPHTTSYW